MIHVGNARTALAAWLSARSRGGVFVWRLEDLDPPRVVPGMAAAQMADLAWLGLDWDEGPDVGGSFAPYAQSQRSAVYEEALRRLAAAGRLFPCRLSRKDLQSPER
jgi:glutamyl-tRNA synthetase